MRTVVVAIGLAVAFGAGVLLFPHALDPGRAERDGFSLELLQPGTDQLAHEDWYLGSSAVRVLRTNGGARVVTDPAAVVELTSRSLPVVHRACYRLSLMGRTNGDMRIQIADEKLRTGLGSVRVPKGTVARQASVIFGIGDRRRISLLVRAQGATTADIDDLRLDRTPDVDCSRA